MSAKNAKPQPTRATGKQPLAGSRILVSRAKEQAGTLSQVLRAEGAEVLEIPFIEIHEPRSYDPLDSALKNISDYNWLILTSVNGVRPLFERLAAAQVDRNALQHLRVVAIGPATKAAIEKRGLKVEITPREYVAESVVETLRGIVDGQRVLLVRAKIARDVIPRELEKMGARVNVVEAYETVVPEQSRIELRAALKDSTRRPHAITFTSSSTVRNFVELIGREEAVLCFESGVKSASIGPVTSNTLREFNLPVSVQAEEYTIPGLVRALVKAARK